MIISPARVHKILKGHLIYSRIKEIEKEFEDVSPPRFLIGEYGYPNVNVGILTGEEGDKFNIDEYIKKRILMVNNVKKDKVFSNSRFVNKIKEIGLSLKVVDIEVNPEKVYKEFHASRFHGLYGPKVKVNEIRVVDNVKTKNFVEKIVDDEIKAEEAVLELYKRDFSIDYISQLFTTGNLGIKKKLVPTKWSITAVDDIIAKNLLKEIRGFEKIDKFGVGVGKLYGNTITIFLIPDVWGFELNEKWYKGSIWESKEAYARDYEEFYGRKDYAENTSGGYYASRIPIVEYLFKKKKQALTIVFREVSSEYQLPLGVWVVREATKRAVENLVWFEDFDDLLKFSNKILNSKLFNERKKQKKLYDFEKV